MRRVVLALALAMALAPVASAAIERGVSIVSYHVTPDPAAGSADADPFAGVAWPLGDAETLPRTVVDRALVASDAPEGDPASAAAHFQEARRLVQERERQGATLALRLVGAIRNSSVWAEINVTGDASFSVIQIVVIEDGALHSGRAHRFVARASDGFSHSFHAPLLNATQPPREATLPYDLSWGSVAIDPSWDASRLGLVVALLDANGTVLQSATWLASQGDEPTEQRSRAPLVEHLTATWCAPCIPSDEALTLLASQSGFGLVGAGARSYAVPASPALWAGLAAGALAGILLARRRAS